MTEPAVAPTTPVEPAAPVAPPPAAPVTDWRTSLPTDIQNHPSIADTKSVESLTRQYIEQGTLIGRKGIIPPADDSPEEMGRYYSELGRPASSDLYKFSSIDAANQSPEVLGVLDTLRPSFHGHGLTEKQADGITKDWFAAEAKNQQARVQQNDTQAEETVAALRAKWGMAYPARHEQALRAGKQVFGEETLKAFAEATLPDGSLVGNHPDFIESLYENLGKHMGEDTLTTGSQTTSIMTPEAAQAEITRLETDKEFAASYFDKFHPEYKAANDKMKGLYAMANPQEGT